MKKTTSFLNFINMQMILLVDKTKDVSADHSDVGMNYIKSMF